MSTLTQFYSSIKSIQRGTISRASGDTTATATITAVNTSKSFVNFLGATNDATSTSTATEADVTAITVRVELTDSTTVTLTRGSAVLGTVVASYEVVEFI